MYIETQGHGPDLVLIHGWAMHSGIFAPLSRHLKSRFRIHLVDLPGHGYSRDSNEPFSLVACANEIAAAVPAAIWIGWSLGGLVCLEAAQNKPKHVQGLVLLAASPRFVIGPDWPHGVAHDVFAQFGSDLHRDYYQTIERFLALEVHGCEHAQAQLRDLKAQVFAHGEPTLQALDDGLHVLDQADFRPHLATLNLPSLWIAGRRDRLIPPYAMQWAAQQGSRGRYLEFSSGHAPFIQHAQAVADAIGAFADGVLNR